MMMLLIMMMLIKEMNVFGGVQFGSPLTPIYNTKKGKSFPLQARGAQRVPGS